MSNFPKIMSDSVFDSRVVRIGKEYTVSRSTFISGYLSGSFLFAVGGICFFPKKISQICLEEMSRIGTEFLLPSLMLGSFGISSISDASVKDYEKTRHSAGKESIRLIKQKFCSGDNSEAPYTLKREELFASTTSPILRSPNLIISSVYIQTFYQCKEIYCSN